MSGRNPAALVPIYKRILEVSAVKGRRSLWPRKPFVHKFSRGGRILGVKRTGMYRLRKGELVVRGRKPLWKTFDYDPAKIR